MREKKKILLAEDYEESRKIIALYLTRLGYDVAEASDGKEVLKQAALAQPDLILMDVSMPRMDGLEATTLLKADAETQHIPVLITTAHIQRSVKENALRAGASDVITKPFDLKQFRSLLDSYLQAEPALPSPIDADDHAARV